MTSSKDPKNKYLRPYCEHCKLIWGIENLGYLLTCTKCQKPLILKSFNPWPKAIGGIVVLFISLFTFFNDAIGIIWIGGLFFGVILIYNGFHQWDKIKKLDNAKREPQVNIFAQFDHRNNLKEDEKHMIITCGQCYKKFPILKGQGVTKVKCPSCSKEYNIRT